MTLTSRRSLRPLVAGVVLAGLAVAGTAAAFLLRSRRDVTTSSEQAWKIYHQALENDLKMYEREAISGYAAALQHDPHFVMATLRLADKMRGRDPERAKSLLASAARSRDEISAKEQLILRIYEERWGKHDKAALGALFDEYVRRFPDDPEGYQMRAHFLASQKRMPEALAEFERLLSVNPNYASAYNTLGYASAVRGDFAKAEDYLKRYRFLAPDQANPLDSLGEFYALTGRYEEAEEILRKALAIKGDFYPAYGHLGTVEIGRGDPAKAAQYFRKASNETAQPFTRLEFRFYASMALLDAGEVEEARREKDGFMAEAAGLPPESEGRPMAARVAVYEAAFLARTGETASLAALLEKVRPLYESEPDVDKKAIERDAAFIRGIGAAESGRCEEAVALLQEAQAPESEGGLGSSQYYPGKDFGRVLIASCLHNLGRDEDAEKSLEPLVKRNARFAPAVAVLARIHGGKAAAGAQAARAGTP